MKKHSILIIALLMATTLASGCAQKKVSLVPLATPRVMALEADDIVRLMLYAGFERDDILEYGTALRNGLATHGAAQMRSNNRVKAVFAVLQEGMVHVSTVGRGNFAYNVQEDCVE